MDVITKYTGQLGQAVLDLLPDDPFKELIPGFEAMFNNVYLEYLNYFIPVGVFLKILAVWLVAVGAYYAVMPLARWAKLIK